MDSMSESSINKIWMRFYILYFMIPVLGVVVKYFYIFSHDKTSDHEVPHRSHVKTFTRIRFIDNWMFLWPFLYMVYLRLNPKFLILSSDK
jgi:hypothetical protein